MQLAEIHPIRSLFFDLDGTIIDSCPGIAAALSAAFRAAGRIMPTADLRTVVGPPIRIIAARVDSTLTESDLMRIEEAYRAAYDSNGWLNTVLFDGVLPALQQLRDAGAQLFVVTNKPKIPTAKILSHFGMMHLFEEILTRDSRNPGYSDKAEMLSTLLLRHRLSAESAIMIGDTAEDRDAAIANRLEFIHARYGFGSISTPCRSIACFADLGTALSRTRTLERF